jgi:hypothetical protein
MRAMTNAFHQAWALIERKYTDPRLRQSARLRLAGAIVDVTPQTGVVEDTIRRMAVDLFMILDRDEPLN